MPPIEDNLPQKEISDSDKEKLQRPVIPEMVDTHILVDAITLLLNIHDNYTAGHSMRVAFYSEKISRTYQRTEKQHHSLHIAAHLHDIGKTAIASHILNKSEPLTEDEFCQIREHSQQGYDILNSLPPLKSIAKSILHHHERFDGKGYPGKLKGKAIPLDARIIAVADAFDAMTTNRPYRKVISHSQALAELTRCSGMQFDPDVVTRFKQIFKGIQFEREELNTPQLVPIEVCKMHMSNSSCCKTNCIK